jgi:FkbM family methyltransferase
VNTAKPLIVYGLGSTGVLIVDELLEAGVPIDLILDRGKQGTDYRGIPVKSLDDPGQSLADRSVLIALHNHYVDLVLTPIHLGELVESPRTQAGYWLDPAFEYAAHADDFARARTLLADHKSRDVFDAILRYRQTGNIADCPRPSLDDEYTPHDLPRYAEPVSLVDCGAFTGVAIHKFLKAGYAIDRVVAFEPDLENFATLAARQFPVEQALCLPLGTWSSTRQFRFSSGGAMASHLDDEGDVTIQCVAVDDVLHGETVTVVKLDVEGAEIETLKGMERLIRDQRPNLLVSAYHAPDHLYAISDLINGWELGYSFHLRVHEQNSFGIVLYALQEDRLAR